MTTTISRAGGIHLAEAFTMPAASPMIPPPPYRYRDTKALNILFKTDSEVARRLVPEPLGVMPNQPLVFYIGHYQFVDFDASYNEAGLLVPVEYDGNTGLFAVVLYLDKANPVVGGREIYGWPKKDADEIVFRETDGKVEGQVTRYGHCLIRASLEVPQRVDAIPARPVDTFYLLKLIPSIEKGEAPDVLKLVATTIEPDVIKEMRVGRGSLRFGTSPFDSVLVEIPIREIVYSEVIVHDFTLGFGRVVMDYLAQE